MITARQIKYLYSIRPYYLRKDEDAWRELIASYTGSKDKTSVKDLTFDQANQLIKHLGGRPFYDDNWGLFDKSNSQHLYVLSLLNQLGWTRWDAWKQRHIPDTRRLSNWLKSKRSPVRKPVMKMTSKELTKIISALEAMVSKKQKV